MSEEHRCPRCNAPFWHFTGVNTRKFECGSDTQIPSMACRYASQLQERINRLESVVNDPHALWANWLRGTVALPAGIGDVRQYQDRIKRLEEAVDELMYDNDDMANINRWHKAKEGKS